ncbi:proline-rich protein 2-like [Herrania umbratica]|uniref:Proline-rich protein 2-like n=1 Tax=Herrania umbratica TaxID=108875 RepID=A0A6J1A3Y0_9ROSI|nr:proline-rich protein 2-like [Herrania umbratica]
MGRAGLALPPSSGSHEPANSYSSFKTRAPRQGGTFSSDTNRPTAQGIKRTFPHSSSLKRDQIRKKPLRAFRPAALPAPSGSHGRVPVPPCGPAAPPPAPRVPVPPAAYPPPSGSHESRSPLRRCPPPPAPTSPDSPCGPPGWPVPTRISPRA